MSTVVRFHGEEEATYLYMLKEYNWDFLFNCVFYYYFLFFTSWIFIILYLINLYYFFCFFLHFFCNFFLLFFTLFFSKQIIIQKLKKIVFLYSNCNNVLFFYHVKNKLAKYYMFLLTHMIFTIFYYMYALIFLFLVIFLPAFKKHFNII